MRPKKPEVMDVDDKRLQAVADRAKKQQLEPEDAELIARVFESYKYVTSLIGEKNMSIGRLQKMLFGAKTEKTKKVAGNTAETQTVDSGDGESKKTNRMKPMRTVNATANRLPRATAETEPRRIAGPSGSKSLTLGIKSAMPAPNAGKARSTRNRPV